MIRRALVTVRLPGARMAPIRRTCAQSQTRWENSGRNARMTNASSAGKVGIKHYISDLLHTLITLCMHKFDPRPHDPEVATRTVSVGTESRTASRAAMDKVELRGRLKRWLPCNPRRNNEFG